MAWTYSIWMFVILMQQCKAISPDIKTNLHQETTDSLDNSSDEYYSYENSSHENGNSSYEYYSYENSSSNELTTSNDSHPSLFSASPAFPESTMKTISFPEVANILASIDTSRTKSPEVFSVMTNIADSTSSSIRDPVQFSAISSILLATLNPKVNILLANAQSTINKTEKQQTFIDTKMPTMPNVEPVGLFPSSSTEASPLQQLSMQNEQPDVLRSEINMENNLTRPSDMQRSTLIATCDEGKDCTVIQPDVDDDNGFWMKAAIGSGGTATGIGAIIVAYLTYRKKKTARQVTQLGTNPSPADAERQTLD